MWTNSCIEKYLRGECSHCYMFVYIRLCILTAELGDFHSEEHVPGYLAEFRFVPNATDEFENEVCEMHKQHK